MSNQEQLIQGVREISHKTAWLNRRKMETYLNGYKSSEVHCIELIGRDQDCNVTKLAEAFYMTRGAISKVTKKLMAKGIIESYQKPDNKKEIYFRLTEQGKEVFETHEQLHIEFRERDKVVFEQLTKEQIADLQRFVEGYNRHLDAEIKKMGVDVQ